VGCGSPWTVLTEAATALLPSCPAISPGWLEKLCQLQGLQQPAVPRIPGGTATASCAPRPWENCRRRGNGERLEGQDQP